MMIKLATSSKFPFLIFYVEKVVIQLMYFEKKCHWEIYLFLHLRQEQLRHDILFARDIVWLLVTKKATDLVVVKGS